MLIAIAAVAATALWAPLPTRQPLAAARGCSPAARMCAADSADPEPMEPNGAPEFPEAETLGLARGAADLLPEQDATDDTSEYDEFEALLEEFFTPGSPLDLGTPEIVEFIEQLEAEDAENWARKAGLPRDPSTDTAVHDFLSDPVDGFIPALQRRDAVRKFRARLQPLVRAALFLPLLVGWRTPGLAAAVSLTVAPWVHILLPLSHLALAARANLARGGQAPRADEAADRFRPWRGWRSGWRRRQTELPQPRAPDLVASSYLLCASGLWISQALRAVHNPFEPLVIALGARLLMLGARLAFTRYSFTSTLLCRATHHFIPLPRLECPHYCTTIALLLRDIRPPTDPPSVC